MLDSSLFQELSRAHRSAHSARRLEQERTLKGDLGDGSSENYLGGEPLILFVDLVWVPSISSTIGDVDKSNENHFDNLHFNN